MDEQPEALRLMDKRLQPPANEADFVLSYVRALVHLYDARDGSRAAHQPPARSPTVLAARDLEYHLREAHERIADTELLVDADLPDRRPFFYPCAYVDLLPFLRSGLRSAVYLDTAYLTPSRIRGSAFCLRASVLRAFFEELFPGARMSSVGGSRLRFRFAYQGEREITLVRGDRRDMRLLTDLLPRGAEVLFDPELPVEDPELPGERGSLVALALEGLRILQPELAFFRTVPRRRQIHSPFYDAIGSGSETSPTGGWLARRDDAWRLAA